MLWTIPAGRCWVKKLSARVEPLRELFAGEELDGALELALQARRGLLSCLAEAVVEGLHRDLGVPLHLALGDPLEPLGLAPLPLDEHDVEARADVDFGALDRLGDGGLAGTKPLGGTCSPPLVDGTEAPMIHVWIVPNECGPFAALDGIAGGQVPDGEAILCDHAHGSG